MSDPNTAIAVREPSNVTELPPYGSLKRPVLIAIAAVMRAVGSVEKRGENKFHGYMYATAADIAQALQKLMAEHSLVVVQRERDTRYDADMGMLAIRYDFDVLHASGDRLDPVQQTGMSAAKNSKGGFDDKAANKCHTAARKYFLLGLFQIPTGDYPDADAQEDQPAAKPSRTEKYRETKKAAEQTNAGVAQSEPPAPKFEVVTGDGEVIAYDKISAYLTGIELAVTSAHDPAAVWADNLAAFTGYFAKYAEAKHKGADALAAVQRKIEAALAESRSAV